MLLFVNYTSYPEHYIFIRFVVLDYRPAVYYLDKYMSTEQYMTSCLMVEKELIILIYLKVTFNKLFDLPS